MEPPRAINASTVSNSGGACGMVPEGRFPRRIATSSLGVVTERKLPPTHTTQKAPWYSTRALKEERLDKGTTLSLW